jgi:myosin heavy subunit
VPAEHIFVKCIKVNPQSGSFVDKFVLQQLHEQNIVNSVKFVKTSYPSRMSYNEYYKRYHSLDPINKKIPLQRHIGMGTDMRGLVVEMNKRLFPGQDKRAIIFGENTIYMKSDTGYKLEGLLQDWNRKLDSYATKIQGGFKVAMFRKKMMERVSKLAKVAKQNPELKGRAGEALQSG